MKKLPVTDLTAGMITGDNVISPMGQLILKKGQTISEFDIAKFGFYNIPEIIIDDTSAMSDGYSNTKFPSRELKLAHIKEKYHESLNILEKNLNDIILRTVEPDEAFLIEDAVYLFERMDTSYELFNVMHELQKTDTTTMAHSMNVSILCRLIGVWADFDSTTIDMLTMAGLLHDIGKLRIPEEILCKPGKLTADEFEIVKNHTLLGYETLKDYNIPTQIKYGALLHHEKFDGSGYPFGYSADHIDDITGILTIADVYDAMTAKRCYHEAMCPFDVLADFEYDGINKYHPKYINMFLSKIANTYIGSDVILSNGDKAKIIYVTDKYSRPTVSLLSDGSIVALKDYPGLKIMSII